MSELVNILVYVICTVIVIVSLKKIINGNYCIIDFCLVAFYGMQIIPLFVEAFCGVDDSLGKETRFFLANSDSEVNIIYGIMVICVMSALAILSIIHSKKYCLKYDGVTNFFNRLKRSKKAQLILSIMMVCPIFLVILAPNPILYLTYKSIWRINQIGTVSERMYHNTVIYYGNNLALIGIMIKYFTRTNKRIWKNIDVVIAIVLMTWVDGKRALFIMAILGIIIIDIINKSYQNKIYVFLKKIVALFSIIVIFFFLYGKVVDKLQSNSFITNYSLYLGRMSSVKVAIYDMLHKKEILDYPGQTILFDLFFYIPRSIWKTKPSMFTQYFTAYAINSNIFVSWNLHVNIWTEMIANFGLVLGCIAGVICTHLIAKASSKSNNLVCQMTGMIFLIFYYMFGFEIILMILFIVWVIGLILSRFKIKDNTIKFVIFRRQNIRKS